MLLEATAIGISSFMAFYLRFDGHPSPERLAAWRSFAPILIVIRLASAVVTTQYRLHWRFTSLREFWHICRAVLLGSVVFAGVLAVFAPGSWPRGAQILEAFLTLNALMLLRLSVRMVVNRRNARCAPKHPETHVLVVGAGASGERIVRQMLEDPSANLVPLGFVDDDPGKLRRSIHGVSVLGTIKDVGRIAETHCVEQVLIAIPSLSGAAISSIVRLCASSRAELTILPTLPQMLQSDSSARSIRPVRVEDLLERSPIQMDMETVAAYTRGERILVTGAGGSIGSELCRQLVALKPATLILLGHDEGALYWIDQELRADYGFCGELVVADVKDRVRMDAMFTEHQPTVVFHAAAHKHVPMMEANPGEAVKNNIFGTRCVAELSISHGVKRFVMISTDKAVNPTSVMGATKRVAEMVVQSLAQRIELARRGMTNLPDWGFDDVPADSAATIFTSVRFGNVLGSSGSVIPTMQRQIEKGGPVTVTDPEMTRFFMTIPEAVQLVIQAGGMGRGGEVFVLDMGKPVKIIDLAWNLIRLSGFVPDADIAIKITGARPGEKLYEEVLTAEEGTNATSHEKICVARATLLDHGTLEASLTRLEHAAQTGSTDDICGTLAETISTYRRTRAKPPRAHPGDAAPSPSPVSDRAIGVAHAATRRDIDEE